MTLPLDWLSRLLDLVPVRGHLDLRCQYGAPWEVAQEESERGELPYHVILAGSAILAGDVPQRLEEGDILVFPHGAAHRLHDGGGEPPDPARRRSRLNLVISENGGTGTRLDMLCGRFVIAPAHERWMRAYLPPRLVVRAARGSEGTSEQLAGLVSLLRSETAVDSLGGFAMLNALSTAMFALTLRLAAESGDASQGLLALAGHPRLAPALAAMFNQPAHPWTLPELARLCNLSRATLARHFQDRLGRSASDLLTDIRMTLAARKLEDPSLSTGAVAEEVGYQSEAAFQRAFKLQMGVTPAAWRRTARLAKTG